MSYGTIKIDTITFTDGGIDKSVSVSGLTQNPTFSGNIAVTGTVSGNTIQGVTVSGVTGTFTSGVFASGTAAAPSVSIGTTDNGLYSPGTDQVAISTNGTGRLFVDASGNVGVGVAPSARLHSYATLSNSVVETLRLQNASDGLNAGTEAVFASNNVAHVKIQQLVTGATAGNRGSDCLFFTKADGGSISERLRITSDGQLGLGSSSPGGGADVRMWIDQSSVNEQGLQINASGGTKIPTLWFRDASAVNKGRIVGQDGLTLATSSSATPALTIDNSQRVGIGTTSPGSRLEVGGETSPRIAINANQTASTPGILLQANGTTYGSILKNIQSGELAIKAGQTGQSAYFITFGTNDGSERARIDSSGRLLVGTSSSPSAGDGQYSRLVVQGNTIASAAYVSFASSAPATSITSGVGLAYLNFTDNTGNTFSRIECYADANAGAGDYPGRLVFSTTADGASSPTERMRIDNAGQIIVTRSGTAASPALVVGGDQNTGIYSPGADQFAISTNGTEKLRITSDGKLGLGTSSPQVDLHIATPSTAGDGALRLGVNGTYFSQLQHRYSENELRLGVYGDGQHISFYNNSLERARIDDSGRLLVGTSSAPTGTLSQYSKFSVYLNNQATNAGGQLNLVGGPRALLTLGNSLGQLIFTDSTDGEYGKITCDLDGTPGSGDYPGRLVFSTTADGSSSPTERMRITSDGKLGVGTSSPAAGIHIATAGQTTSALDTAGSINLLVTDTGASAGNGGSIVFGFNSGSGQFASIKGQVITGAGNSTGHLTFSTRNATSDATLTERLRITNDGYLRLAGAGIQFNGDTAAANALDDYEEGTWTVTDSSGASLTISTNFAIYTKTGDMVFAACDIVFPTTSNSNFVAFTLPFTGRNYANGYVGYTDYTSTPIYLENTNNSINMNILSGSFAALTNANFSGKRLIATFVYKIL